MTNLPGEGKIERRKGKRLSFLFTLLAVLGVSCATPLPPTPSAELEQRWSEHAAIMTSVSQWEVRGRLAVRIDGRGGQATLHWARDTARHSIQLNGPFGSGAVRVVQDASGARLRDAENREVVAATAEELLYQYSGWQLPVAHLDWWLRGLPVPGLGLSRELDEAGRLKVLRQQGWEIQYPRYARIDRYDLPQRLTLVRVPEAGAPSMEARLVIDRWSQVK